jgi:hypothetical protein
MNRVSLLPLPVKLIPPPALHRKIFSEQVRVMIDKEARIYSFRRNTTRKKERAKQGDEQNCTSPERSSKTTAPDDTPLTDKVSLIIAVQDSLSNGCAFHLHQRRQQDDVAGSPASLLGRAASSAAAARARNPGAPGTSSARRSITSKERYGDSNSDSEYPPSLVLEDEEGAIDAIYRLRMSEWSYRVIDYFGVSREIVAISFDYLDRFIDSEVFSW